MRVTRWILAILCGSYGLINVVGLVVTYGAKGGWLPLPSNMPQLAPLVEAVYWWQAPLWLAVIILYLVVALRLIRGRSAFGVYILAFVVDLVRWLPMRQMEVYGRTFTRAELQGRYVAFGVLILMGAIIWLTERRRPPIKRL
jgi:hypothetical protein